VGGEEEEEEGVQPVSIISPWGLKISMRSSVQRFEGKLGISILLKEDVEGEAWGSPDLTLSERKFLDRDWAGSKQWEGGGGETESKWGEGGGGGGKKGWKKKMSNLSRDLPPVWRPRPCPGEGFHPNL